MSRAAIEQIKRWSRLPKYNSEGFCIANGGAVDFVREVFNAEPDAWQIDYLNAYQTHDRVAAKACKGPGKTTAMAWCDWHFMVCHQNAKIIATSISGDNLRDGLWAELAKWQQRSEFLKRGFTWHAERVVCNQSPEQWFMSARKWSKDATGEQQANTLAGLHADDIMFNIDEAGGVPDAVMAAAEAALANAASDANPHAVAKMIIAGNPTHLSGPLYRACTTEATLWHVIEITGDPDDPKRSPRISIEWARQQIEKYGRDNPWVLVNVFGKFPPSSINGLLGPDDVHAAMKRVLRPEMYMREVKTLGIDCGGGGADPSVLAPKQGPVYFQPKLLRLADPKMIAAAAAVAIQKFEPDMTFVDNTGGWGSGVISWLREWGYQVTGVGFAEKALDPVYANKRTEMLWAFAHDVKEGACLPDIPALKVACVAQEYTHQKDKLIMLPKDELKEGVSDTTGFDILDAMALNKAFPVAKRSATQEWNQHRQKNYDPITGKSEQLGHVGPTNRDYDPLNSNL